jgi:hypothetical protein
VAVERIAFRHEPREERLEVAARRRVGVLLHDQACGRVAHEHGAESVAAARLGHELAHE